MFWVTKWSRSCEPVSHSVVLANLSLRDLFALDAGSLGLMYLIFIFRWHDPRIYERCAPRVATFLLRTQYYTPFCQLCGANDKVRLAPTCVLVLPSKPVGPNQLCWSKHFPLAKSRTLWVSYISALHSTLFSLTASCPTVSSTRKTLRCFYCTSRYSIAHSFMRYYLLTCPAFNSELSLFGCPPWLQEGESCVWVLPQRIMCKNPFILRHRSLSHGCQTTHMS